MGELQGQGVMKYHNGDIYQGQWNHNKREGMPCLFYVAVVCVALVFGVGM